MYAKVREIVACKEADDDNLNSIIVRFGGFHTAMSFLGSIGYLMNGSGLKEALCEIFAANSVNHVLNGHAYRRAVRGHTLTQSAIAGKILFSVILICDEVKYMTDLACNVDATDFFQKLNSEKFRSIKNKFLNRFDEIEKNGPSSKLWLQDKIY